jgi:hypothetical protein
MILNAYAVLDGSVALLRLVLGLALLVLGASAWRLWVRPAGPEGRTSLEDRCYLLAVLAVVLLALSLVSWPLFYLLLQSYVAEWPGVMCVYGVTRIGTGTRGPSRLLPGLVTVLQLTKPALVFASGAWFVLYLADRRTATAPLRGRILLALLALGLLAVLDAAAEGAYLGIPKKEEFVSAGCCTEAFDSESRAARFVPQGILGADDRSRLYAAYWAVNGGLIAALLVATWLLRRGWTLAWLTPLVFGALLATVVNGLFVIEVAAPTLLHLPHHHCPYDLLPAVPESVLGVVLFIVGGFAVGWACVVGWGANCSETRPFLRQQVVRLLSLAVFGYLGSLVLLSVELALS